MNFIEKWGECFAHPPHFYGTAEFWVYEKLRRTPEDSDYKGGEKICDADVRQAEEVRADAEDEDAADVAEVLERGGGHDRLDRAGGEEDRPLEDADRECGENAALPEGRGEQHDDDAVEDALGEEDGRVGEQAVAHRADDGHRRGSATR